MAPPPTVDLSDVLKAALEYYEAQRADEERRAFEEAVLRELRALSQRIEDLAYDTRIAAARSLEEARNLQSSAAVGECMAEVDLFNSSGGFLIVEPAVCRSRADDALRRIRSHIRTDTIPRQSLVVAVALNLKPLLHLLQHATPITKSDPHMVEERRRVCDDFIEFFREVLDSVPRLKLDADNALLFFASRWPSVPPAGQIYAAGQRKPGGRYQSKVTFQYYSSLSPNDLQIDGCVGGGIHSTFRASQFMPSIDGKTLANMMLRNEPHLRLDIRERFDFLNARHDHDSIDHFIYVVIQGVAETAARAFKTEAAIHSARTALDIIEKTADMGIAYCLEYKAHL